MTTAWGTPVDSLTAVLTAGPRGPLCLQDSVFFDMLTHFDRERIPERVVHAKGAGNQAIHFYLPTSLQPNLCSKNYF